MNLEDVDLENLPRDPDKLLHGKYNCPCHNCDRVGSRLWIRQHFETIHRAYEQEYAMMEFVKSEEYEEYTDITLNGVKEVLDSSKQDEQLIDAIRNHPIFSEEMYFNFFEDMDDIFLAPERSCKSKGHEPFTGLNELQEKIRIRNTVLNTTIDTYGPDWGKIRWSIYQRDNEMCRVTGKKDKHFSKLDVHHIKPAREFVDDNGTADYDAMNDPSNLITLTDSVHGRLEGKFTDCDPDEFVEKAREYLSIEQ